MATDGILYGPEQAPWSGESPRRFGSDKVQVAGTGSDGGVLTRTPNCHPNDPEALSPKVFIVWMRGCIIKTAVATPLSSVATPLASGRSGRR